MSSSGRDGGAAANRPGGGSEQDKTTEGSGKGESGRSSGGDHGRSPRNAAVSDSGGNIGDGCSPLLRTIQYIQQQLSSTI